MANKTIRFAAAAAVVVWTTFVTLPYPMARELVFVACPRRKVLSKSRQKHKKKEKKIKKSGKEIFKPQENKSI